MAIKNVREEKVSEVFHEAWESWSQEIAKKEKLSKERLNRWKKLWIPYKNLTELEKESDRNWARKVAQRLSKKRKPVMTFMALFITALGILSILFLLAYGGYSIGKNQYKYYLYDMCRSFDFMAYINTENIRHYQNSTFELSQMPNCEIYYHPFEKASLTYNEWLYQNNLTHINWTNKNKNETRLKEK